MITQQGKPFTLNCAGNSISQHYVEHAVVCEFGLFAGFVIWVEVNGKITDQGIYAALIHCSTSAAGLGVGLVLVQNWEP